MDLPLISIITVNFNNTKDTLAFIKSCDVLSYPNIELIIVDNNSNAPFNVQNDHPFTIDLQIIHSPINLGFAGGNNLGIKKAKGDFFALLNNDTLLPSDFFDEIIPFFRKNPKAGIISPKIIFADNGKIQFAGARSINLYTGRGSRIGLMEEDKGQYNRILQTDLVHGASMVIPKYVIEKVGLMDEDYFLYYEEHDWCERIKRNGFKAFYFGLTQIVHKESSSIGENSPLKTYYMARNRILFLKKNASRYDFVIGLLFVLSIALPKNLLEYLLKGRFDLLKAYLNGVIWNLSGNVKQF